MIEQAERILAENKVMSIATAMPDGWPQCTMVAFANEGLSIYFVISKASLKFENILKDDRVSMALAADVMHATSIKGLSIAARASEVEEGPERQRALDLLMERRPSFKRFKELGASRAAVMKARPEWVSIIDYSQGFGHSTLLKIDKSGAVEEAREQKEEWGYGSDYKPEED